MHCFSAANKAIIIIEVKGEGEILTLIFIDF